MKKYNIILISVLFAFVNIVYVRAGGLTIYTEDSYPGNFLKNGELTGSSVEIVRQILKRLNESVEIQLVPWSRGYYKARNEANVALFSTTRTAEREKLFQWVGPILRVRWAFYGRKGTNIRLKDLEEAKKLTVIGTIRDDAREQYLKKQGFTNLHSVSDNIQNMKKLMNDRIDLLVSTNIGIARIVAEAGFSTDQIEMLFVIKNVDLYIAFSKTTDETIVRKWQGTLKEVHEDGTFASIYRSWYPGESPPALQN